MSENVQNRPSLGSTILTTVKKEGVAAATGAVIGSAAGAAAGLVVPASKNLIAEQIKDHLIINDKNLQKKAQMLSKAQVNEMCRELIKKITGKERSEEALKVARALLEMEETADKNSVIKALKGKIDKSVKQTSEEIQNGIIEDCKKLGEKALDMVKNFFAKSKADRKIDPNFDLINQAKKCAKKVQFGKFVGTGIAVGIFAMLFKFLFDGVSGKQEGEKPPKSVLNRLSSKLNTHQG